MTTPAPTGSASSEDVLFEGRPATIASIGPLLLSIVTLGILWVVYWVRAKGRHYRITTQRIVVDQGIFSKKMDQIDLYRIKDYTVERPFGQRLLGTGNIVLQTMDSTTPALRIEGIRTDVVALYERLRVATENDRRHRGVRLIDNEVGAV